MFQKNYAFKNFTLNNPFCFKNSSRSFTTVVDKLKKINNLNLIECQTTFRTEFKQFLNQCCKSDLEILSKEIIGILDHKVKWKYVNLINDISPKSSNLEFIPASIYHKRGNFNDLKDFYRSTRVLYNSEQYTKLLEWASQNVNLKNDAKFIDEFLTFASALQEDLDFKAMKILIKMIKETSCLEVYKFIPHNNSCTYCSSKMLLKSLKGSEINQLRDYFTDYVSQKSDLDHEPKADLELLYEYASRNPEIDMVIDFSNIYINKIINEINYKSIFKFLKARNIKKICLLTSDRSRIYEKFKCKIPSIQKEFDVRISHLKLGKYSKDDIFIILLAMLTKNRCYVFSNDEFRNHLSILPEKLRLVFKNWQKMHHFPKQYSEIIQRTASGWHIPYKKNEALVNKTMSKSFGFNSNWICLKNKI